MRSSQQPRQGVAIGGDRYPGSTFADHIMRFEADPNVRMLVLLGEVGGDEEYWIADAVKEGRIKKPLIACTNNPLALLCDWLFVCVQGALARVRACFRTKCSLDTRAHWRSAASKRPRPKTPIWKSAARLYRSRSISLMISLAK